MKRLGTGVAIILFGVVAIGVFRLQTRVADLHREISLEMSRLGEGIRRNDDRVEALQRIDHDTAVTARSGTLAVMTPAQVSQLSGEVAAHLAAPKIALEAERTPEQLAAASKARDLVNVSLSKKTWTEGDRTNLQELEHAMNGRDLYETHRQLAVAINRQALQVDVVGFPF